MQYYQIPLNTMKHHAIVPVFYRFLLLGGSIWAATVQDEQGIPLHCSGHPICLYFKQKISHPNGATEINESGPKSTFCALLATIGAQCVQLSAFDIPTSRMMVDGGYWG